MSAIDNARSYLAQHIDTVLATYGVPSMSAVMVRDGGDTVVAQARGVRKWDVDHGAPSNQVRLDDGYSMGSISKAFTGYLMAYLVQTQTGLLGWETTIADV